MAKKILVIYKSKTGFTKRYAEMIAEEVTCTLMDYKDASVKSISDYDIIVFGSRAHAGMIDGYKKAKELFQKSGAGNFVVFVTGASPNAAEDVIDQFWKNNLTLDELEKIPHFYMQSGLSYERMTFSDKAMMKVASVMIKNKKNKDANDIAFEKAISSSYDISSKEYVKPLVSFLNAT